jgi:hypothetical protein
MNFMLKHTHIHGKRMYIDLNSRARVCMCFTENDVEKNRVASHIIAIMLVWVGCGLMCMELLFFFFVNTYVQLFWVNCYLCVSCNVFFYFSFI